MEVWEAMRPHIETAMEAGKNVMENAMEVSQSAVESGLQDPRAKQVAIGSAAIVVVSVCLWSLRGSTKSQQVKEAPCALPSPTPEAVPKPYRSVRKVQWPLSRAIKQSPYSPL